MSKYNTKRECRCCHKMFEKKDIAKFGICRPCEEHVKMMRSGPGIKFVFPEKCPDLMN